MKWIEAKKLERTSGKTDQWIITSKEKYYTLGVVKWYGAFRKYSFFPAPDTIFEEQCMRDLADFCETETNEYKNRDNQ